MSAISLKSSGVVQLDLCLDPFFETLWLTLEERIGETDRQQENMCDTEIVFILDTLILDQWFTVLGYASFILYLFRARFFMPFCPLFSLLPHTVFTGVWWQPTFFKYTGSAFHYGRVSPGVEAIHESHKWGKPRDPCGSSPWGPGH